MISDELEALAQLVSEEAGIAEVSIIDEPALARGAHIEHGSFEAVDGGSFKYNTFPVYVSLRDEKANWKMILRQAEIIQKEIKNKKAHRWTVDGIERIDDESDYVLRVTIRMIQDIGS